MSGRLLQMSGRELRTYRTFCPAGINTHRISDNDTRMATDIYQSSTGKCLTRAQNVRQNAEGLPNILSSMPEIIFAITGLTTASQLTARPQNCTSDHDTSLFRPYVSPIIGKAATQSKCRSTARSLSWKRGQSHALKPLSFGRPGYWFIIIGCYGIGHVAPRWLHHPSHILPRVHWPWGLAELLQ